jgi:eukaryotic-like serine/threonine-protein kinase
VVRVAASENDLEVLRPQAIFHGRYEILRCLKAGGMGAVYEVLDAGTRRRRALKTMLSGFVSDPDMRARFHLEATVAADIESEHIVEVFDAGVDEATGLPFLVMELLKGQTLAEALERRGRLAANDVVTLLHQASMALDKTHAAGIVHRDLKPENLFITRRDDGSVRLKVLDFGIAKVVAQSSHAKTTRSFGTPLYMSPEQIRGDGDIGHRSDLYSMGQIAFSLLAGRPYWAPESERTTGVYGLLVKIMDGAPEPGCTRAEQFGARLPKRFDGWFRRATALDPGDRFESASELVEELAKALEVPVPHSVRRVAGDTFAGHAARIANAPTAKSPLLAASAGSHGGDSTGAVSSGGRFTRRSTRREKLVWAALIIVTAAGAIVLLGRHAFPDRNAADPSAAAHHEPSAPAARTAAPQRTSVPDPSPRASAMAAIPSATEPAPATKPPVRAPRPKPAAPKSTSPSPKTAPRAPAATSTATSDPSDVR